MIDKALAEACRHHALGQCLAHREGQSLAGAGEHGLDTWQAIGEQGVIDTAQFQDHTHDLGLLAAGDDNPVPVGPGRRRRIEAQNAGPERGRDLNHGTEGGLGIHPGLRMRRSRLTVVGRGAAADDQHGADSLSHALLPLRLAGLGQRRRFRAMRDLAGEDVRQTGHQTSSKVCRSRRIGFYRAGTDGQPPAPGSAEIAMVFTRPVLCHFSRGPGLNSRDAERP